VSAYQEGGSYCEDLTDVKIQIFQIVGDGGDRHAKKHKNKGAFNLPYECGIKLV
jgi:hypothetical protein